MTPAYPLASALPRHQRRQARPVDRVATRWDSCARRINLLPFPPHPPTERLRASRGRRGRKGGKAIGFCNASTRRHLKKAVDWPAIHYHLPRGSKASAEFARFKNPRNGCFYPRVWCFYPQVGFLIYGLLSFYFFIFLEERESRDREKSAKMQSTGRENCNKVSPRVFLEIHANLWMVVDAKPSVYAGCSPIGGAIHHPRAEMPMYPLQALFGGPGHE